MKKLLSLVGLSLALCLSAIFLPACNKTDSGDPNKPYVAFISNNDYEFWTICEHGTEAAAKDFNARVEFRKPSGGGTAEQQRRFIEDLISKGVKAIAISPNDSANQAPYFSEKNKELPILAVDNDIPDVSARRCYIGTDNVAAGRAVGKLLKQTLPTGGKFMIFVGKL